jgi:sugar phosphate isomerase/epimerase
VLLGLHTGSILYTNVLTDVRVAREAGYDAIEIVIPKLVRYLDAGYGPDDLLAALGPLRPAMINSFLHIERQEPEFRRALLAECERLCAVAQSLGCRALQVIALNALRGMPWPEMRLCLARSLAELADIVDCRHAVG